VPRVEEYVEIKRPVNRVFAYLTDEKNWPHWTSSVLEAEQTSVGQIGIGTTFRGVDQIMGHRIAWVSKITEYEPNRRMSHVLTSGNNLVEQHLTFNSIEGGTKFNFVYDMKAGGLLKFIAPILVITVRKAVKKNLNKLKAILEEQA